MKILFEVWGNYKNWQKVSYRYNEKEIESNTTLPLLLNEISPEKYFIIVSDTLIENIIDGNFNNSSYKKYIEKIEENTKDFIEKAVVCTKNKEKEEFEILILPGVGTFNQTKFIGNPLNFYSVLYYELVKRFIKIAEEKFDNQFEIYLDITHGINYMTMMTYKVIKEISQIIAFFYKVKFVVLNSDPKIGSENVNLVINKIEDSNIIPRLDFYIYNNNYLLRPSQNISDEEKKELGRNCPRIDNETFEKIFSFVGSFLDALPLFIYHFHSDDELDILNKAYNFFYNSLKIENQGKLLISHYLNFSGIFISIVQYQLLKSLLKRHYGIKNKNEVYLIELIKLQDVFNFSRTLKQRLAKEIKKIQDIKLKLISDYKDYGSYVLEDYKEDNNFDERNFFAHCGFGYNIVQLKEENNEIILKLKDCFVDRIKNYIIENIPKGD